ncbi:PREDICTED: cyclic GMP-binding protein C-like [Rhagoletis zephyria]|uniref:cyclic GMP-binding protein C-like n=1 Tax=Rhagoletis zephyria TaxID=28612 RepID=UPI000811A21B|nr:PREDICTED: cyclic GMP-binding protein C-like [Rhagoletis zephyria]
MLKLLFIFLATQSLVTAAPKNKSNNERVAALFIKDSENGELRFLTGTNSVNQLITQSQDLLEQLRPSDSSSNTITPIYINLNGGNAATTSPTTTTGTITSTGNSGAASNSPIVGLLPQIVGQAVAAGGSGTGTSTTGTTTGNRRRVNRRGNKRRRINRNPGNRRRRRRRKPQAVVVRPQRG